MVNTPKTKKPKRWQKPSKSSQADEGAAYFGIKNDEISSLYGFLVSYWWHVEEVMAYVFTDLIDGRRNKQMSRDSSARKIFRTIIAQEARIKIMRELLQGMQHNAEMPDIYDEIIDEFDALNAIRNRLVHGSWMTDAKTLEVTLRRSGPTPHHLEKPQVITTVHLREIIRRMQALHRAASLRGGEPVTTHR